MITLPLYSQLNSEGQNVGAFHEVKNVCMFLIMNQSDC